MKSERLPPSTIVPRLDRLPFAAVVTGAVFIAFSPIFVRLSELQPTSTAFYRMVLALPFFALWVGIHENRDRPLSAPARREYLWPVVAGLFFTGDLAFWHWSITYTSVANATLLANLAPVFVTTFAWLLFGERITGRFLAGMVVAIAGTMLLVRGSFEFGAEHLWGDLLGAITALFYAGYILGMKRSRRAIPTARAMGLTSLVTAVGLLGVAAVAGEGFVPRTFAGWMVLIGLALVSQTAGQGLIVYGLAHLPASFSSVTLLIQPTTAALLAWIILAEPLTWWQAAGGAAVIGGIILARTAQETPAGPPDTQQAVAEQEPAR